MCLGLVVIFSGLLDLGKTPSFTLIHGQAQVSGFCRLRRSERLAVLFVRKCEQCPQLRL
jgi:hypothetical protein